LNAIEQIIRTQTNRLEKNERIKELSEKRGTLKEEIGKLKAELETYKNENQKLESEKKEIDGEYTTWKNKEPEAKKIKSIIQCAGAYKEATEELIERAGEMTRDNINQIVSKLWPKIMGREEEFNGLEFDKDWKCHLIKKDNTKVPFENANLSAGQRQVRLLSFYEALRQLARAVPPLVVDTPLGRLDEKVRESVLNELYLNEIGNQTIILSTDSEIPPEDFQNIKQKISNCYTLTSEFHPESDTYQVKVSNDYFSQPL